MRAAAEPLEGGETVAAMAGWARRHAITLVGGSITESREGREKLSNTCVVFDPSGEIAAVYRKIHLFDVEVGGLVYRESEAEEPGEETVVCDVEGWPVGLYRLLRPALSGALPRRSRSTAPSSSPSRPPSRSRRARTTGSSSSAPARSRTSASSPPRTSGAGREGGKESYGRSLIVDPWGVVLAQAPDEDCVIAAELDRARLREIRTNLPSLASTRLLQQRA